MLPVTGMYLLCCTMLHDCFVALDVDRFRFKPKQMAAFQFHIHPFRGLGVSRLFNQQILGISIGHCVNDTFGLRLGPWSNFDVFDEAYDRTDSIF